MNDRTRRRDDRSTTSHERRCWPISPRSSSPPLGKTRDIYRIGSGPAVIVMAEIPGITPNVAAFGRKVAAIGCTAVLPHLFGVPGAAASVTTALKSIGPACVSREFSVWALKTDQSGDRVAASAGGARARAVRRARGWARSVCASPGASPWP